MEQGAPKKPTAALSISAADAYRLGEIYYFGLGKPKDYVQAVHWLTQAAQEGHSKAQSLLSECYAKGRGVAQNFIEAATWLIQAASQGDADAQYDLGVLYQNGRGVKLNLSFALYWFEQAEKVELAERYEKSAKKAATKLRTLGINPQEPAQLPLLPVTHFQFPSVVPISVPVAKKVKLPPEAQEEDFVADWSQLDKADNSGIVIASSQSALSSFSNSSTVAKSDSKERDSVSRVIPIPPPLPPGSVAATLRVPSAAPSTITIKPVDQKQHAPSVVEHPEIKAIKANMRDGNVAALLDQLQAGSQAAPASPTVVEYLRHDALSDALRAKVDTTAELKGEQHKKLDQLIDVLLADPTVSVIPKNEKENSPVDIALQHQEQLPPELIAKLQRKELEENDRQYEQLIQFVKEHKFDKPEDQAKQAEMLGLLDQLDKNLQALDHTVKSPRKAPPAAAQASSSAASSADYTPEQLAQIERARERLKVRLTRVYTKALAVHYKLLDPHSQSRVGKMVNMASSVLFSFIPIPGMPLLGQILVKSGEFLISAAAGTASKKADMHRHKKHQVKHIAGAETMDLVAQRMMALVEDLTRRYQDVFAHLDPDSVDVFVDTLVSRLMNYSSKLTKRLEDEGIDESILGEQLINPNLPLPKDHPDPPPSAEQQFDNFIQNMMMCTLHEVRKADAFGRVAGITGSSSRMGKAAGWALGDRMVKVQTKQGLQKRTVGDICGHSPSVTWSGKKDAMGKPVYHYCSAFERPANSEAESAKPVMYVTLEECEVRGFRPVAADPEFPQLPIPQLAIPPKHFVQDPQLQRIKELEALLEVQTRRADTAEAEIALLKTRLAELERPAGVSGVVAPIPPLASSSFAMPGVHFLARPPSSVAAPTPLTTPESTPAASIPAPVRVEGYDIALVRVKSAL